VRQIPALSFDDIISQASQIIHDRGQIEISWGVLKEYANQSVNEFARRTESVRGRETVSYDSTIVDVTGAVVPFEPVHIPLDVLRIVKVVMLYDTDAAPLLLDRCEERDTQTSTVAQTGRPTHWYVTDDLQRIGFYPAPIETATFTLDCVLSGNQFLFDTFTGTTNVAWSTTYQTRVSLNTGIDMPNLLQVSRPDDYYRGARLDITSGLADGLSSVIAHSYDGQLYVTLEWALSRPAGVPIGSTFRISDCPNIAPQFRHYLVQYIVARALQTLRPNDAAGAMSLFEQGVAEMVKLKNPKVGFRLKRVREFSDIYEGS